MITLNSVTVSRHDTQVFVHNLISGALDLLYTGDDFSVYNKKHAVLIGMFIEYHGIKLILRIHDFDYYDKKELLELAISRSDDIRERYNFTLL